MGPPHEHIKEAVSLFLPNTIDVRQDRIRSVENMWSTGWNEK